MLSTSHEKMPNIAKHCTNAYQTAMSYHFTPVRTAVIKNNVKKMLARMWGKGNPGALLVGL